MGQRRIDLIGTVYGQTIAELFDKLQDIRTVLTPTVAYALDAPDHGFIPLTFSLPTMDSQFPSAAGDGTAPYVKELEFRARPLGQPQFSVRRDTGAFNGEGSGRGGAITWRASLQCADPRMYVRPDVWVPFTGPSPVDPSSTVGTTRLRLDVLLGVTSSVAGSRLELDIGGSTMHIALGALTNAIVRYSGTLKVLTLQLVGPTPTRCAWTCYVPQQHDPPEGAGAAGHGLQRAQRCGAIVLSSGTRLMYSESFS